jgi:hypothetical protein
MRLGPYEITAKLGEGGMGEVWRATDSKLRREVAIKLLPAAFTADPERLARFEREAQLLAQLHHPHIASVFGLEESGGVRALVMELVEGPTLGERLEQGKLTLEESLLIAGQIAAPKPSAARGGSRRVTARSAPRIASVERRTERPTTGATASTAAGCSIQSAAPLHAATSAVAGCAPASKRRSRNQSRTPQPR